MTGRLWRLAAWLAPHAARPWIDAMRAESYCDDFSSPVRWLRGALVCAIRLRVRHHLAGLLAAVMIGVMVGIEWMSGAALPAVLFVAAIAAVLAGSTARAALGAFIVAGGTLPLAHAVADGSRALWPWYQFAPLSNHDWLILAALFVPAVIGLRVRSAINATGRRFAKHLSD